MPMKVAKMVKLFVGNLPPAATQGELKSLFEQFGKVTECDIITNYAFVHMEDKKSANDAVHNLNQYKLHGVSINVEYSRGKPRASTKLHVSSISPDCTSEELRGKFEEYGTVLECDIVKDYAFVHMEKAEEALEAIRNLNNFEFKGKIRCPVQSTIAFSIRKVFTFIRHIHATSNPFCFVALIFWGDVNVFFWGLYGKYILGTSECGYLCKTFQTLPFFQNVLNLQSIKYSTAIQWVGKSTVACSFDHLFFFFFFFFFFTL
ncbi:RNA-binding protein 4B-like isoform X3 [Pyxicephalus adspersus]|uniref:RNA-binding protein 4B-like isoform X3 n=1 Tax=Pyxicephalus adspersus TaxID=30357 RepID=UPI003B5A095E